VAAEPNAMRAYDSPRSRSSAMWRRGVRSVFLLGVVIIGIYVVSKPSVCKAERKERSNSGSSEAMWTIGRRSGGGGMVDVCYWRLVLSGLMSDAVGCRNYDLLSF
jgi:hypothetical protein